jgi:hypothetical protein
MCIAVHSMPHSLVRVCVRPPPPPPREGVCYRGSFYRRRRFSPATSIATRALLCLQAPDASGAAGLQQQDGWHLATSRTLQVLQVGWHQHGCVFVFLGGGGGTDTVWSKAWSHGAKHGIVEWDAQPQRLKDKGNWNRVMHTAPQRAIFQAYCSIAELQRLN